MSDTVISVENLSKEYRLGVISTGTFYGDLKRWWAKRRGAADPYLRIGESNHGNRQDETIWALREINFAVRHGEALGIIGRNGAGKSTLLKILSQVTAPTSGVVKVKGRIASLLEVGTGFHPELTGRENIYLNGAIMGMGRDEVSRKFDEIVDFSGVEKFIDTPVKRYSSGMYVRLAFAVAAHLEPEILVVDEVLAVGDAEFQKKCLGKMSDVTTEGRTVLFVSHNMAAIGALCNRVIYLSSGDIGADGLSNQVISYYLSQATREVPSVELMSHPGRRANMEPVLKHVLFLSADEVSTASFQVGSQITFEITLNPDGAKYDSPALSIAIFSHVGVLVCKLQSSIQSNNQWNLDAYKKIRCIWPDCRLAPGKYHVNFGFANRTQVVDYIESAAILDIQESDVFGTGKLSSGIFLPDVKWLLE